MEGESQHMGMATQLTHFEECIQRFLVELEAMTRATHVIRGKAKEVDTTTMVLATKSPLHFMKKGFHIEFKRVTTKQGWPIKEMEE